LIHWRIIPIDTVSAAFVALTLAAYVVMIPF
jgi:hypothetical protein